LDETRKVIYFKAYVVNFLAFCSAVNLCIAFGSKHSA